VRLRQHVVVAPILLCIASCGVLADTVAGPRPNAETLEKLGDCYRMANTSPRRSSATSQAAPLIEELVNKYPDDGPYLPTVAGRMYQDMKQYDKAIALFKFVVERFPNSCWQLRDALVCIAECMCPQRG